MFSLSLSLFVSEWGWIHRETRFNCSKYLKCVQIFRRHSSAAKPNAGRNKRQLHAVHAVWMEVWPKLTIGRQMSYHANICCWRTTFKLHFEHARRLANASANLTSKHKQSPSANTLPASVVYACMGQRWMLLWQRAVNKNLRLDAGRVCRRSRKHAAGKQKHIRVRSLLRKLLDGDAVAFSCLFDFHCGGSSQISPQNDEAF